MISHYKMAGIFLIISGLLHIPMFLVGGFTGKSIQMAIVGVVWVLLGLGLRRQMKYLACVVFALMLVGIIVGLTSLNTGPVPNAWWWLIILADLLTAIFLFRIIWSKT